LNRFNEQNPVSYDKRTYTVDEIQDILGISRPTAYGCIVTDAERNEQELRVHNF